MQGRDGGWARVGGAHPSFFLGWVGAPTMESPKKIKNRKRAFSPFAFPTSSKHKYPRC